LMLSVPSIEASGLNSDQKPRWKEPTTSKVDLYAEVHLWNRDGTG